MQSIYAGQRSTFLAAITARWRQWIGNRPSLAELANCDRPELQCAAQQIEPNPKELRVLAGKWPESENLLTLRLAALQLEAAEIILSKPGESYDLRQLCS